jgi:amino acid adenylation domain-containing protein
MNSLLQDYSDNQAELRPDADAIVMGQRNVPYGELARSSNRLARLLVEAGCRPGDRVCLMLPKSPEAIMAIVAILKSGCVYVPLDTGSPPARLARVIRSSAPTLLLASGSVSEKLAVVLERLSAEEGPGVGWLGTGSEGHHPGVDVRFAMDDLLAMPDEALARRVQSSSPAYILFTSGSTGEPKGVVVTHANVIHFVEWATSYFRLEGSDRISGHSPLHFDLSVFDVFGAFSAGAQLFPVPPELNLDPSRLAGFIRSNRLTQWFSVPSILSYLIKFGVVTPDDFPRLKRLIWCGEPFPTPRLREWMELLPHVTFTNLYGPTETTIASSYYTVPECPPSDASEIPIGRACPGEELLVLDGDLVPVGPGEVGDLYISGAGLSLGYWRDADRTSEAFGTRSTEHDVRLYRTGDLAHVGDDQLIYLHGRTDSQIKSRGYRIELGEIEAAVHTLDLTESAVVAVQTNGFEGYSICCAYSTPPHANVTAAGIRSALSELLPTYMLPSRWMELDALPRNANGKIDRPALRAVFGAVG